MDNQEKICYWCGNTGITWYDSDWGECTEHEYRKNNELSIYAREAIKNSELKK